MFLPDKESEAKGFDCILTNPPFSPMSLGYQFLEKNFQRLKETGELAFILPWNVLLNSSKRMHHYYPYLKQAVRLDRSVFPGTRIQRGIFHFSRQKQNEPPTLLLFNSQEEKND